MTASAFSRRHRPWPDLPSELLGIVLARLASHADRVRFSAVCPAWRSSARLQCSLPPPLPWLCLRDGAFLSLPDGAVHRFDIPGDVLCRVSIGSALFLVHADGSRSLMNPSSSATTLAQAVPDAASWFVRSSCPLNIHRAQDIRKVVFAEHLVAVLYNSKTDSFEDITSTRRWQRRSSTEYSYLTVGWPLHENMFIADIAIFKGELYLLTTDQELHLLDDQRRKDMDEWGICGTPRDDHEDVLVKKNYYLVVSGDQLLMVKRLISLPPTLPTDRGSQKAASRFEVFEATDLTSSRGRWTKVDNSKGRALFISEGCSESLPVTGSTTGIQEDCIYFVSESNNTYSGKKIHESPFLDSGVYNMREQTMTPLPFETVRAAHPGQWYSTWFFPET